MLASVKVFFRRLEKCLPPRLYNWLITAGLLVIATALSYLFFQIMDSPNSNIALTYVLAVFLVARFTPGYGYGLFASIFSVFFINYRFTYPFYALNFTMTGYPITFIATFAISSITSAITSNMKEQARILSERDRALMIAEKETMRANLLRAVSHDLRTPLTSIIGSSTVYLERNHDLTESQKSALIQHILEDSNWLLNMVENLLSVTRINNQTARVNKSPEPVEEVISEAVIRLKKRLPNARINVKVPDDFLMIPMDAVLIEQVLINLMENAIVHSRSEEPVECYVENTPDSAIFHVRDYGVGIPPERLPTIFDSSSSTASTAADGRRGMGIGLSICKTIISAHSGSIQAVNHTKGAEFFFALPKEDKEIDS